MQEEKVEIKVSKLREDAHIPEYEGLYAYVFSAEDVTIKAGQLKEIHTGIHIEVPKRHRIEVRSTQRLALEHSLFVISDIRAINKEELVVTITNQGEKDYTVKNGDTIAKIALLQDLVGVIVDITKENK